MCWDLTLIFSPNAGCGLISVIRRRLQRTQKTDTPLLRAAHYSLTAANNGQTDENTTKHE